MRDFAPACPGPAASVLPVTETIEDLRGRYDVAAEDDPARRRVAADLAEALLRAGRFAEAREVALPFRDAPRFDEPGCLLLLHFAAACMHVGDLVGALRVAMDVERGAREAGHAQIRLSAVALQGDALAIMGRIDEARVAGERGLRLAIGAEFEPERARLLGQLGRVLSRTPDVPAAMQAHLGALELHRKAGRSRDTALELINLGFVCSEIGFSDDAVCYVEEALSLAGVAHDDHLLMNAERTLSWALKCAGRHEEAVTHGRAQVAIAERIGGDLLGARAAERLGTSLVRAGLCDEALAHLVRAANVARGRDDAWLSVAALVSLAEARVVRSEFDAAESALDEVRDLRKQVTDDALLGDLHRVSAMLHGRRGEFEQALMHERRHGEIALDSLRRAGDARTAALRLQHESEHEERLLQRALASLSEGVLLVRPDGSVVHANAGAARIFSCGVETLASRSLGDLICGEGAADASQVVARFFDDPRPRLVSRTLRGRRADGAEFPAEIALGALRTRDGVLALVSVRDVSQLRRTQSDLHQALDQVNALRQELERENLVLRDQLRSRTQFDEIVGSSPQIRAVLRHVEQVAPTDATVLILGETGTGKELIARAVHTRSTRSERPLVTVNCAAMPESLIESELFGHVAGAFTGALRDREGRFAMADGGTIFLDEIGDLPLPMQSKLLRVLQDGEVQRVGAAASSRVDARVIAATNRDLPTMVADGSFRSDLFYRLNVFPLELPALRRRRGDIPVLVWFFVQRSARRLGVRIDVVPDDVMARLRAYDWPGNVRELANVIERAVILAQDGVLSWDGGGAARSVVGAGARLEDVERAHILEVLESRGWRVKGAGGAADVLGLNASTLRSRMRKLGIERPA